MSDNPYFDSLLFVRELDGIVRFNKLHKIQTQTVSSHSYHVTIMSFMVADELVDLGQSLDLLTVVSLAIIHDLGEAVTGDILYPTKNRSKTLAKSLHAQEREMLKEAIPEDLPRRLTSFLTGDRFFDMAKRPIDEYTVVKFCDMFELVIHMYIDYKLGNTYAVDLIQKGFEYCIKQLEESELLRRSPMLRDWMEGLLDVASPSPFIDYETREDFREISWINL